MEQIAFLASLFVAGAPTIKNVLENPRNESTLVWGMFTLGFGLTVIAIQDWSTLTVWIQPILSTMFSLLVFVLSLRRKLN